MEQTWKEWEISLERISCAGVRGAGCCAGSLDLVELAGDAGQRVGLQLVLAGELGVGPHGGEVGVAAHRARVVLGVYLGRAADRVPA